MANSRLEKIGTIYSRTRGLIQSGALKWEDKPLWYDIYEAHPPTEEPRYDRPAPQLPLKQIFYEEDKIRAMFHKNYRSSGTINMFNNKSRTLTQRFIETYKKIELQYNDDIQPTEKLYNEAIDVLQREFSQRKEIDDEQASIVKAFKEAQASNNININVKDIFKE